MSVSVSALYLFWKNSNDIHVASIFNMFDPEIATIINVIICVIYTSQLFYLQLRCVYRIYYLKNICDSEITTIINSCNVYIAHIIT